jgi:hypothetical protein
MKTDCPTMTSLYPHTTKGRTFTSSSGSVIIEFILVLPVLLAMIGYSLRLTQLLQAHQIAMAISREAATEAFSQCTDVTIQDITCLNSGRMCMDTERMHSATSRCLARIQAKYSSQWPLLRPAGTIDDTFSIDLEVYRYDMDQMILAPDCSSSPSDDRKHRVTTNGEIPALFTDLAGLTSLCQRNRVARARLIFKFAPTAAFLNLNQSFINQTYDIIDDTIV